MDQGFLDKIEKVTGMKKVVFSIGKNTTFNRSGECLTVRFVSDYAGAIEHVLASIDQLIEGDADFISEDDEWTDKYLPLLMAIETEIDAVYKANPNLKDKTVRNVLERLIMKPDIRMEDELTRSIQAHVRLILSTAKYSRKELLGCLKKVQRSVKRHHLADGPTGYLDFIKGKV